VEWTLGERVGESSYDPITTFGELPERSTSKSPLIAHRQIVFGRLIKVFPFAIVTYCVQQTGVYTGGPTGVYTGGPNGGYPNPAAARPATARPATPNWSKAAAALAAAALSIALADAQVRDIALSAVSPILNITGPRFFIVLPNVPKLSPFSNTAHLRF
jgi:hypothetical protein